MKTIYLIHHTHTDIGYTEIQGRIIDRQIDFIRQAIRFAEDDARFRWTCETFWAVEAFFRVTSEDERNRFIQAVRKGSIDVSASYLNFSELLDFDTHRALARRAATFAESHGIPMTSAMTADINGHSLANAVALADAGVENFFACVHTWHGMYPLFGNQLPFYWQLPGDRGLLVWNGDHYHLGNELGVVPGAWMSHMVNDRFRPGDTNLTVAERRIPRYLEKLAAEGYPYDFVPLMVSGLMTDNAPPNPAIPDFLDEWNALHGKEIRLELSTLEGFFQVLRKAPEDIPVYEGLWPDWWADLAGAAPAAVKVFREGQRYLGYARRLMELPGARAALPNRFESRIADAENTLALYAEHTFGHSATYMHPHHLLVAACSSRKSGYAAEAFEKAVRLLDDVVEGLGSVRFEAGRPLRFRVVNPYENEFEGLASFELDGFEWGDIDVNFEAAGLIPKEIDNLEVADARTGETVASQAFQVPRGIQVRLPVQLEPGETRDFEIRKVEPGAQPFLRVSATQGIDGGRDIATGEVGGDSARPVAQSAARSPERGREVEERRERRATTSSIETDFVRIEWAGGGIIRWIDRKSGRDLLAAEHPHAAFMPVYEVSPGSPRTPMGRNRKSAAAERRAGRIKNVIPGEAGILFTTAALEVDVPGTKSCALLLRAHRALPLVEIELTLHKETCADVESLYLPLPFSAGDREEIWIDTSVEPARPWMDQIPGTLIDYFHIFEGFGFTADQFGIGVATPDSPLLQLGPLEAGSRLLAGTEELQRRKPRPYAWLMNNFWETNANIDLAGFYCFRFSVFWGPTFSSAERIVRKCRELNAGPVTFRTR